MTLKSTLEQLKKLDYSSVVEFAKDNLLEFKPFCEDLDEESDGRLIVAGIVVTAINADGEITEKEKQFIKDVLNLSANKVESFISYDPERIAYLVNALTLFIHMNPKAKVQLCAFVATLLIADNRVTISEENYLRKLIEK